jgi:hypothetical protein
MGMKRRLEQLEATHNAGEGYESPIALDLYFKRLENERRKQAGEPPIRRATHTVYTRGGELAERDG